jgi:hypothetical protein
MLDEILSVLLFGSHHSQMNTDHLPKSHKWNEICSLKLNKAMLDCDLIIGQQQYCYSSLSSTQF